MSRFSFSSVISRSVAKAGLPFSFFSICSILKILVPSVKENGFSVFRFHFVLSFIKWEWVQLMWFCKIYSTPLYVKAMHVRIYGTALRIYSDRVESRFLWCSRHKSDANCHYSNNIHCEIEEKVVCEQNDAWLFQVLFLARKIVSVCVSRCICGVMDDVYDFYSKSQN